MNRTALRQLRTAAPFVLPHMAGLLLFLIIPVLETMLISFFDWNMITAPVFAGIANYRRLLFEDSFFAGAMWNTLLYTAGTVTLILCSSLLTALGLNRNIRGRSLFRTLYFIPNVSSLVAVSLVWTWIYNNDFGLINNLLKLVGVTGPQWLSSTRTALPAVMVMSAWTQFGFFTVIFLSGLQGIPKHLYEAAQLDGVNPAQALLHVTLPLLSPTTFFVLVMSIINSFQVFEQTMVMTKGGPAFSTTTAVMHIYQEAFRFQRVGYAAAMSWALFVIIFGITVVQVVLQRRWVYYEN